MTIEQLSDTMAELLSDLRSNALEFNLINRTSLVYSLDKYLPEIDLEKSYLRIIELATKDQRPARTVAILDPGAICGVFSV